MTVNSYIKIIKTKLSDLFPEGEANALVAIIFKQVCNYSAHDLILHATDPLQPKTTEHINRVVDRLLKHEPIQYILGETEFYDLTFSVSPDVLIPRNETEELVHHVITENPSFEGRILDIGTGSGCIAVSLKKHLPKAQVLACDISTQALEIARHNAQFNLVDVSFFQLDILKPQNHSLRYDIIVSNPPYVTEKERSLMAKNVLDFEPETALFVPNNQPLLFYTAILKFAAQHLSNNGVVWFEINEAFASQMNDLLSEYHFSCTVFTDINNKKRMIRGKNNSRRIPRLFHRGRD